MFINSLLLLFILSFIFCNYDCYYEYKIILLNQQFKLVSTVGSYSSTGGMIKVISSSGSNYFSFEIKTFEYESIFRALLPSTLVLETSLSMVDMTSLNWFKYYISLHFDIALTSASVIAYKAKLAAYLRF